MSEANHKPVFEVGSYVFSDFYGRDLAGYVRAIKPHPSQQSRVLVLDDGTEISEHACGHLPTPDEIAATCAEIRESHYRKMGVIRG